MYSFIDHAVFPIIHIYEKHVKRLAFVFLIYISILKLI